MKNWILFLSLTCAIAYSQNTFTLRDPVFLSAVKPKTFAIGNGLLNSLQAYWKMDETGGPGSTRFSSVDSNNYLEDSWWSQGISSATGGKINGCSLYPSVAYNDILANTTATISIDGSWSFGGWVWIDSASLYNEYEVIAAIQGVVGIPQIYIAPDGLMRFEKNIDGEGDISTYTYSTDQWIYLTMTYDSLTMTVSGYINGTLVATDLAYISFSTATEIDFFNQITSGTGYPLNTFSFSGRLDEWGFWNKCLTQTDIDNLYNSGGALPYGSFTH
jgi:hypothetical protein